MCRKHSKVWEQHPLCRAPPATLLLVQCLLLIPGLQSINYLSANITLSSHIRELTGLEQLSGVTGWTASIWGKKWNVDSLAAWWVQILGQLWSFGNLCHWVGLIRVSPSEEICQRNIIPHAHSSECFLGFPVTGAFSNFDCLEGSRDTLLTPSLVSLITAKGARSFDAKRLSSRVIPSHIQCACTWIWTFPIARGSICRLSN